MERIVSEQVDKEQTRNRAAFARLDFRPWAKSVVSIHLATELRIRPTLSV